MKTPSALLICILFLSALAVLCAGCSQAPPAPPATPVPASPSIAAAAKSPPSPQVSADLQKILDNGVVTSGVPGDQVGISTTQWTWNGAAGNASPVTGVRAAPGMQFFARPQVLHAARVKACQPVGGRGGWRDYCIVSAPERS